MGSAATELDRSHSRPMPGKTVPFTVDADLDLGTSVAPWVRRHGADVTIRRGPVPDSLANPESEGGAWTYAKGRQLIRLPCGLRLLVEGGDHIRYAATPGLAEADIRLFLMGTALPALALERGLLPLQASAVTRGGDVHAFRGTPVTGKSVLAAALAGRGYPFFADDCLILDPAQCDDGAWCWRYDYLKLHPMGLALVDLDDRRAKRVRETDGYEKVYAKPGERFPGVSGRLRTMYVLRRWVGPSGERNPRIRRERVLGSEAARRLFGAVHRSSVAVATLGYKEVFRRATTFLRHMDVYDFFQPATAEWFGRGVDAAAGWLSAHGSE